MTQQKHTKVISRNESFVDKTITRIWHEKPSDDNPYITENCRCHGYDLLELTKKRSFIDVLYLLFRGELPTKKEAQLLEHLMIALINPGPRHPATRAAMSAGVGKTDPAHILPIGLTILGGKHLGASEIEPAMRFLRKNRKKPAKTIADELLKNKIELELPGFGSHFNSIEIMPQKIANQILELFDNCKTLEWANELINCMSEHNIGWLSTGLAAAVFSDLGFQPRVGTGLYQLISAPGLLAHGIEMANKPITAMPFISDENYVIEK